MIKLEYLVDCNGADRFGTCMGCGKGSKEDPWMARITVSFNNHGARQGTTFCLCDKCRSEMRRELECVYGVFICRFENMPCALYKGEKCYMQRSDEAVTAMANALKKEDVSE